MKVRRKGHLAADCIARPLSMSTATTRWYGDVGM
jgi:hypothetical protein